MAIKIISLSYILKSSFFFANFIIPVNLDLTIPHIGSWQVMSSDAAFNYALLLNALISVFLVYMLIKANQELRMIKMEKGSNE